jgi:hypothetical protein
MAYCEAKLKSNGDKASPAFRSIEAYVCFLRNLQSILGLGAINY